MFRAALAETKVGPDPLPPQVEPLLLPVEPLPGRPDFLGLALHHDDGPALPLHSVSALQCSAVQYITLQCSAV